MQKLRGILYPILVVLWLVGSVIALIIAISLASYGMILIVFGEFIGICGIISVISMFKAKRINPLVFFIPIVGLSALGFGIYSLIVSLDVIDYAKTHWPYVLLNYVLVFSILLGATAIANIYHEKKVCVREIKGKCIDIHERVSSSGAVESKTYCPVYSIYYQGDTHRLCSNSYSNYSVPTIDEEYLLHINPKNPEDFYDRSNINSNIALLVFSGAFTLVAILVFFFI